MPTRRSTLAYLLITGAETSGYSHIFRRLDTEHSGSSRPDNQESVLPQLTVLLDAKKIRERTLSISVQHRLFCKLGVVAC
jgi:hypothetical protein